MLHTRPGQSFVLHRLQFLVRWKLVPIVHDFDVSNAHWLSPQVAQVLHSFIFHHLIYPMGTAASSQFKICKKHSRGDECSILVLRIVIMCSHSILNDNPDQSVQTLVLKYYMILQKPALTYPDAHSCAISFNTWNYI